MKYLSSYLVFVSLSLSLPSPNSTQIFNSFVAFYSLNKRCEKAFNFFDISLSRVEGENISYYMFLKINHIYFLSLHEIFSENEVSKEKQQAIDVRVRDVCNVFRDPGTSCFLFAVDRRCFSAGFRSLFGCAHTKHNISELMFTHRW